MRPTANRPPVIVWVVEIGRPAAQQLSISKINVTIEPLVDLACFHLRFKCKSSKRASTPRRLTVAGRNRNSSCGRKLCAEAAGVCHLADLDAQRANDAVTEERQANHDAKAACRTQSGHMLDDRIRLGVGSPPLCIE